MIRKRLLNKFPRYCHLEGKFWATFCKTTDRSSGELSSRCSQRSPYGTCCNGDCTRALHMQDLCSAIGPHLCFISLLVFCLFGGRDTSNGTQGLFLALLQGSLLAGQVSGVPLHARQVQSSLYYLTPHYPQCQGSFHLFPAPSLLSLFSTILIKTIYNQIFVSVFGSGESYI